MTKRASADSDEVADGVVLDFDQAGALVGIDVQHASRQVDFSRLLVDHMPFRALGSA